MKRTMRTWQAGVLLLLLTILGSSCGSREEGKSSAVQKKSAGATEETRSGGVQTTEGQPVVSGARSTSGASRGKQGSSSAKGSRSTESLPEGTISKSFEIAFSRARGQYSDAAEIYLMNADGSDLRKLGTDQTAADPGWSPDGKLIAFTRPFYQEIQWMNVDGSGVQSLHVRGFSPTWSPDGGHLAFGWNCVSNQSEEACSAGS